jgi:hypothetical protein
MKTLVIPFQINCLNLSKRTHVAEASANFSSIPYFDKEKGITVNSDNPYISENIVSQPFQNQNLILGRGVHLHFILPKQLISPVKVMKDGQVKKKYPAVPNRWLIIRKVGEEQKEWVVESDYLWAEDTPLSKIADKITIPLPVDVIKNHAVLSKPFRAMGRTYEINEWLENGEKGEYWETFFNEPLTALGYGNETFAGFFPNCRGVFSFYDEIKDSKDTLDSGTYKVYGWHSKASYAKELMHFYEESPAFNGMNRVDAFEKELNWIINNESGLFPEHLLFYSSIEIGKNSSIDTLKNENTAITLGNTGTEALSAFLAQQIAPDNQNQVEDLLEAIQFDKLIGKKMDVKAKFEEARHEKSFNAKTGGTVWHLDIQQGKDNRNSKTNAEFSTELKRLLADELVDEAFLEAALTLSKLNDIQRQYDTNHWRILSKKHQLFADWYKYMLSAHPPQGQEKDYPRADDVLQFINRFLIGDLNQLMQSTGIIQPNQKENGSYDFRTDFKHGLPRAFLDTFNELQSALSTLNNEIQIVKSEKNTAEAIKKGKPLYKYPTLVHEKIAFKLQPKPSQRYYEANEPVVLLAGEVAKSSNPSVDYTLDCYLVDLDFQDMQTTILDLVCDSIEIVLGSSKSNLEEMMPPRRINQQDWNPTLLEWEVEYIPVNDPSDEPVGYPMDFLVTNYDLPIEAQGLALKPQKEESFSNKIRKYRGSTILTEYAKKALQQKFRQFDKNSTTSNSEIINAAKETLSKITVLSQSMGGFNQALLMRKQTMQLEVDDPIALKNYEPLIENIRNYIGASVKSAPEPGHYFNPIRAGGLNISRLRVIDAFGRTVEVFNKSKGDIALITNTLQPPPSLESKFQAVLPPRFTQPARLNMRWIAADDDTIESNQHPATSPICGWVVPNFVDERLTLYDTKGNLLGDLGFMEDNIYPIPKPGADNFYLTEIKNKHFSSFVNYILYHGEEFFYDFLAELRDSLEFIDPETADQHSELAMLMGRPLAIVRAKMNLELMEDYAINQDWNIFRKDLSNTNNPNYKRATYDFERVKIPIRLGDWKQLNDGLVGFWRGSTNKDVIDGEDKFYLPLSQNENGSGHQENSEYLVTAGEGDFLMYQSLADQPNLLTMLFDPRSQLNVATGILPVKTIDIPEVHYKKALENMTMQFLVAPIITPKGKLQMPLPANDSANWHWLHLQNRKLLETPSMPTIDRRAIETAWEEFDGKEKYYLWGSLIEANWITPLKEDVTRAYINFDFATRDKLPNPFNEVFINKALNALYQSIASVVTDGQFGQMEIREGWLKVKT